MGLVLASGSRYKRELLLRLRLEFESEDAAVDESRRPGEEPRELARRLAADKARVVAERRPEDFVLGGDQVIALGDRIFSKPGTPEQARRQLASLSGRTHRLITAICLRTPGGDVHEEIVEFEMVMRALSHERIASYVDTELPLDCAGSYRIESLGISLFESMRGDDYTAIMGLPLTRVWSLLRASGYLD